MTKIQAKLLKTTNKWPFRNTKNFSDFNGLIRKTTEITGQTLKPLSATKTGFSPAMKHFINLKVSSVTHVLQTYAYSDLMIV